VGRRKEVDRPTTGIKNNIIIYAYIYYECAVCHILMDEEILLLFNTYTNTLKALSPCTDELTELQ